MKTVVRVLSSVLLPGLLLASAACGRMAHHEQLQGKNRQELQKFVDAAADLVSAQGENAFAAFREKDGRWFRGERYIFVWGLDGIRYVYPLDPSGEGKDVSDLRDAKGKPIGRMFREAVEGKAGGGWVYYEWPRPGEIFPSLKLTYLKRAKAPSGKEYLLGSGDYMSEPDLALARHITDSAAEALERDGRKAFARFRDPADQFVFGDAYVFVYDMKAVNLFNYATPSIEGKSLWDYKDPKGFYLIREFLKATEGGKTAHVAYAWPKPGRSDLSQKVACVRRVMTPDGEMLVGVGIYCD